LKLVLNLFVVVLLIGAGTYFNYDFTVVSVFFYVFRSTALIGSFFSFVSFDLGYSETGLSVTLVPEVN
jgi:hypothetical protein